MKVWKKGKDVIDITVETEDTVGHSGSGELQVDDQTKAGSNYVIGARKCRYKTL